jgi:CspA family cold shock protein
LILLMSHSKGDATVATGTVISFDATRGFGFIQPDDGSRDVFVHQDEAEKAGLTRAALALGTRLAFDVVVNDGKIRARRLRLPR